MIIINSKKKDNKNFLEFIPIKNPNISWFVDDRSFVVLEIKRTGMFDKFAQKVFKVPSKSNIKLDKQGSFVWKAINNSKSIYEISREVSNEFGKDAEPLFDRLVAFFNILNDNKFIKFNKKGDL